MVRISKLTLVLSSLVIALNLAVVSVKGQANFRCPVAATIAPCACSVQNATLLLGRRLECSGTSVTTERIHNLLKATSVINSVPRTIEVEEFIISSTNLPTLDLNPFKYFEIPLFDIRNFQLIQNNRLTNLVEPDNSTNRFVTDVVTISDTTLDNAAITKIFRTLLPFVQTRGTGLEIRLPRNNIRGNSAGSPFFPGTPYVNNYELSMASSISLANNNIGAVLGGAFALPLRPSSTNTLFTFDLSNNPIGRIGSDAFRFEPNANSNVEQITIHLTSTTLNDQKIEPDFLPVIKTGDARRSFVLNLRNNNFQNLSEGKFRKLLETGTIASMDLTGNDLFCDRNLQWLRAGKAQFQNQVVGANCSNNGGSVFTTKLLFECPPPAEISPCTCSAEAPVDSNISGSLSCVGGNTRTPIEQTDIDKLFASVRYVNSYPIQSVSHVLSLTLSQTDLTHLDLNSASGFRFENVIISQNRFLSSITVPQTSSTFSATHISIVENPLLNNENLGTALSFISPSTGVTSIQLSSNQVRAMPTNTPLIPGLSAFISLQEIDLSGNNIEELSAGNFNNLSTALIRVDLSNSKIEGIRAGALNFQANLTIILDNNDIADERLERGFIANSTNVRMYWLSFQDNSFDFLGQENFEAQLAPNGPIQQLEMRGNEFHCDEKMGFLYRSNSTYGWRRKVKHVACANEPGRTIFTAGESLFKVQSGASGVYASVLTTFSLLFVRYFQY